MTNYTRWWWVRHAPVEGPKGVINGQNDTPANITNEAAIKFISDQLPDGALWIVSPLLRTRQTAEAIAGNLDDVPEFTFEPSFMEQDFGRWQGLKWDQLAKDDSDAFWENYGENRPPGGESYLELEQRVAAKILQITAQHPDRDIVVIAHAGVIRAALSSALDLTPAAALSFTVDTLSLSRIDGTMVDGDFNWRVNNVNVSNPYSHDQFSLPDE